MKDEAEFIVGVTFSYMIYYPFGWFIYSRIKRTKAEGVQKCHAETMMNTKVGKTVDKITHHVSLRQIIYT